MIIFDIETGPDIERLKTLAAPFEEPEPPKPFDPSQVKCGNIGGPDSEKGQAKIEQARLDHEKLVQNFKADTEAAKKSHFENEASRAGLDPVVGRVITIGYFDTLSRQGAIPEVSEKEILQDFWKRYQLARQTQNRMVGFNIIDFDLPFLIRRSWINRVEVPATAMTPDFRFFDRLFVDLFQVWKCGTRPQGKGLNNLDRISRLFGGKGKQGQSGADFAKLWDSDRDAAKKYLIGDLADVKIVAEGLGLL